MLEILAPFGCVKLAQEVVELFGLSEFDIGRWTFGVGRFLKVVIFRR